MSINNVKGLFDKPWIFKNDEINQIQSWYASNMARMITFITLTQSFTIYAKVETMFQGYLSATEVKQFQRKYKLGWNTSDIKT